MPTRSDGMAAASEHGVDLFATEVLASLVVQTPTECMTPAAIERAALVIFDVLASATAGVPTPAARAARAAGHRLTGQGASRVWLTGQSLAPAGALLANIVATTIFDLDDGHRLARGHPAAGVVPVALELAERHGLPADDVLAAVVVGYEVGVRASASRDAQAIKSWASGRWVAYGAAATASRLLQLDVEATTHALAVAGSWAPNMAVNGWTAEKGTGVKEGIAWAAVTGLAATELAADGFTGPRDVLDGASVHRRSIIDEGTGIDWAITRSYLKPYSACRYVHPVIDIMLALRAEERLPASIATVDVFTFDRARSLNNYPSPATVGSAQFSIPYCLALAAIHGPQAVALLSDEYLCDPTVISLAERVRLHVDDRFETAFPARTGAHVVVRADDGSVVERTAHDATGDWALGGQRELVARKFTQLSTLVGAGEDWQRLPDTIDALQAGNVQPLLTLIASAHSIVD